MKTHEISACYSGGPGEPYYRPVLQCSCGFSTGRQDAWEDAGRVFDEHEATIQAQAEKEQRKWEVDQEKYFFVLTGKDSTRKCCRRNSPCEKHKGTI